MNIFDRTLRGRKVLVAGLAVAALGVAVSATADPITYIPNNTDYSIKFVNRETLITAPGQNLFGIFDITQINSGDSSTTFWNGNGATDGTQLVGFFNGLTSGPDQTAAGTGISFTGGSVEIFSVANGTYSPGTNPNTFDPLNQLCGGSAVCLANPWLTLDFVPGINDAIGGNATLQAAGAATANVQAGFGYMSVTGGTNAAKFDTNGYTFNNFGPADMFFRSNFVLANIQTCSSNNGWAVCSDDPIIGRTVPEPGTLALLGLGLASFAGLSRRKKKSA
jgi:hypothetical protein